MELPIVEGRRLSTSLVDFERASLVLLKEEQEKVLPDSALISQLCDSVRLVREYFDAFTGTAPGEQVISNHGCHFITRQEAKKK